MSQRLQLWELYLPKCLIPCKRQSQESWCVQQGVCFSINFQGRGAAGFAGASFAVKRILFKTLSNPLHSSSWGLFWEQNHWLRGIFSRLRTITFSQLHKGPLTETFSSQKQPRDNGRVKIQGETNLPSEGRGGTFGDVPMALLCHLCADIKLFSLF